VHDPILLVVDQSTTVGALPVAVARDEGVLVHICRACDAVYCRLARRWSKDRAGNAYMIAEAARSLPHTLRSLTLADNQIAQLPMFVLLWRGFGCRNHSGKQSHPRLADTDLSGA